MSWIIRVESIGLKRQTTVRYATVEKPEELHVRYRETLRPTGRLGGFTVVERKGWDKSTVHFQLSKDNARMQRGGAGGYGNSTTVKLIHAEKVVREVRTQDADRLAEFDRQIAVLEEQVAALRDERAEFMPGVWKRAGKIGLAPLEEAAQRTLAEIEARKAAS